MQGNAVTGWNGVWRDGGNRMRLERPGGIGHALCHAPPCTSSWLISTAKKQLAAFFVPILADPSLPCGPSRCSVQVELLRQQLANYDKDKLSLQQTKARLLNAEKQVKNLEWENEVLQQRFLKVQGERDELYGKFEASIYDVQQKTGALEVAGQGRGSRGRDCGQGRA